MHCSLGRLALACLAAVVWAGSLWAATPLEQLKSVSFLPPLDLARLKKGEIVVERGPVGEFPRGVHLQSCYFVHAPMPAVGYALLHWNPIEYKDPEVRLYREYALPGTAEDFKTLGLDPANQDDSWLLEQSARVAKGSAPDDLHLTNDEVELLRQNAARPNDAWRDILRRRSAALARGGLSAVAPFGAAPGLSPGSEFRGLLT
ncbi:MAG: hypothetical protein ABIR38_03140, partial [Chthoniobacterales bacterium]